MADQPYAVCRDGAVFIRSDGLHGTDWYFQSQADAQRIRDHFASIPQTDWFYTTAQRFAADLDVAMRQASDAKAA